MIREDSDRQIGSGKSNGRFEQERTLQCISEELVDKTGSFSSRDLFGSQKMCRSIKVQDCLMSAQFRYMAGRLTVIQSFWYPLGGSDRVRVKGVIAQTVKVMGYG